jgi:hypothetical protein
MFQFPVAKEFFNPEPTPKAFEGALPIELLTVAEIFLIQIDCCSFVEQSHPSQLHSKSHRITHGFSVSSST